MMSAFVIPAKAGSAGFLAGLRGQRSRIKSGTTEARA
jgi:hypothetical protein